MRGRKPIPSKLKRIRGTDQPCRMNENEPKPGELEVKPPAHLGKEAKRHWLEAHDLLTRTGVLSEMDGDALCLYAESKAKWIYAKNKLAKEGMVVIAQSGFPCQSPWLAICNKAFDQMVKLGTEFGMTPSSRTRVDAKLPEEPSPLDEFLGRKEQPPRTIDQLREATRMKREQGQANPFSKL